MSCNVVYIVGTFSTCRVIGIDPTNSSNIIESFPDLCISNQHNDANYTHDS